MSETNITFPAGLDEVKRVLPHREPFIWVSRIISCEYGKSCVAELDVSPDLDIFCGHFPGHPVLPGVILMEALAQTSCYCLMGGEDMAGKLGFFATIDGAKFRHQVLPGDTVRLESTIVKAAKRLCKAEVKAYVGDNLAAEASQSYVLGDR